MNAPALAAKIVEWRHGPGAPLTDRAVLGALVQEVDRGCEWVEGSNNYVWWYGIGLHWRPASVVEIGSRFGYSLAAIAMPSAVLRLCVVDDERDADKEPLRVLERHFLGYDLTIRREDSQKIATLAPWAGFDLGSVDADHTAAGCYHDCGLVWDALRPGGLLVVDDTQPGGVRDGAEQFCRDRGVEWGHLPTLRGVHLVIKP